MAQYAERAEVAAPAAANPAPLGLSAFALTTFVLSATNAQFLFKGTTIDTGAIALGLAAFYGGLVQLVAGIQEFRNNNTFGATAFCSYGGFWLAVAFTLAPLFGGKSLVVLTGATSSADISAGVGIFLLGWTIFTGLMFLGTLRSNLALIAVFFFLFLTFLALTIGWLSGLPTAGTGALTWVNIGGWLGIITALVAWYTALAGILASTKSAFQLPVFPMG
ncbi:MAG TPA: acetate uptake transporter [Ktedonobacteraceae bacterium]|jgi:succinate-acetate transporter protein|nr:acetate uptake transporter [Ktedonobacteraceae bacterium]